MHETIKPPSTPRNHSLRKELDEIAKWLFDAGVNLRDAEQIFRDTLFKAAERRSRGNRTMAAELLGVHRNTVGRVLGRDKS